MHFSEHMDDFMAAYPGHHARLAHNLRGHDLLSIDALTRLAGKLPKQKIEWNRGDLSIDQDPAATPGNGLSPEETLQRITDCGSWMVLKNVEHDPAYAQLMADCLLPIRSATKASTGAMHMEQGYIFVSSPGSVTPYHMDPEHNILLQIQGTKTMHVYPVDLLDELPQDWHENYHSGEGHRNLPYRDEFEARASAQRLEPGDALYVPVKAPHRVTNGDTVSVSFSVTWRSAQSDREAQLHIANGALRKRGLTPPPVGAQPLRDTAVEIGLRAARRLGVAID